MTSRPDLLTSLIAAVGEDEALAFLESEAGRPIMVPRHAEGSRLADLYGPGVASVLVALRGGESFAVPQYREWRIRKLASRGLTKSDIAGRSGCSVRRVFDVLRRNPVTRARPERRQDDRQMDIMDFLR